jgi:hypothetical protein
LPDVEREGPRSDRRQPAKDGENERTESDDEGDDEAEAAAASDD